VNGTTGEGLNLTVEERKIIVEEWKKVSKGRLTIVAQVGAGNVKETCDLAMHANRVGVDCIAVIPPTYYKPPTVGKFFRVRILRFTVQYALRLQMSVGINFSVFFWWPVFSGY
jgi:dihydrodipicolinate synthase/N-acetylneuraminate lyase